MVNPFWRVRERHRYLGLGAGSTANFGRYLHSLLYKLHTSPIDFTLILKKRNFRCDNGFKRGQPFLPGKHRSLAISIVLSNSSLCHRISEN
jgi:hypothetical protein